MHFPLLLLPNSTGQKRKNEFEIIRFIQQFAWLFCLKSYHSPIGASNKPFTLLFVDVIEQVTLEWQVYRSISWGYVHQNNMCRCRCGYTLNWFDSAKKEMSTNFHLSDFLWQTNETSLTSYVWNVLIHVDCLHRILEMKQLDFFNLKMHRWFRWFRCFFLCFIVDYISVQRHLYQYRKNSFLAIWLIRVELSSFCYSFSEVTNQPATMLNKFRPNQFHRVVRPRYFAEVYKSSFIDDDRWINFQILSYGRKWDELWLCTYNHSIFKWCIKSLNEISISCGKDWEICWYVVACVMFRVKIIQINRQSHSIHSQTIYF